MLRFVAQVTGEEYTDAEGAALLATIKPSAAEIGNHVPDGSAGQAPTKAMLEVVRHVLQEASCSSWAHRQDPDFSGWLYYLLVDDSIPLQSQVDIRELANSVSELSTHGHRFISLLTTTFEYYLRKAKSGRDPLNDHSLLLWSWVGSDEFLTATSKVHSSIQQLLQEEQCGASQPQLSDERLLWLMADITTTTMTFMLQRSIALPAEEVHSRGPLPPDARGKMYYLTGWAIHSLEQAENKIRPQNEDVKRVRPPPPPPPPAL